MSQEDITQETERNNMPEDIIQVRQASSIPLNRAEEDTMPQQDITQALSVLLKAVGAEAARGLFYWVMLKTGDNVIPLLAKAIQSLQQGRQLSPAEIEQLQKALQQEDQRALQEIQAQFLQKAFQQVVQDLAQIALLELQRERQLSPDEIKQLEEALRDLLRFALFDVVEALLEVKQERQLSSDEVEQIEKAIGQIVQKALQSLLQERQLKPAEQVLQEALQEVVQNLQHEALQEVLRQVVQKAMQRVTQQALQRQPIDINKQHSEDNASH